MQRRLKPYSCYSSTKQTAFIEPIEIIEDNNKLNSLYQDETNEINKILINLSSLFHPHIKKIKTNTLITTGENDVGSTPEMSKNLSKIIKESKFVEIKKGKHLCSIECANDVNMIFREFIDKNND